jgi:hypothetical protein
MRCFDLSYRSWIFAASLTFALSGCGGDEIDPDPVADVPGDEPYAELSDEDRERVCAELDERVQNDPLALEGRCGLVGAFRASLEAAQGAMSDTTTACEMYTADCITAQQHYRPCGTVLNDSEIDDSVVRVEEGPSDCRATVGDFSRCTDALIEKFRQRAMQSCDDRIASLGAHTESNELCQHIGDHCIGISADSASGP